MQDNFMKFLTDKANGCSKAICEAAAKGYQAICEGTSENNDIITRSYHELSNIDGKLAEMVKDDIESNSDFGYISNIGNLITKYSKISDTHAKMMIANILVMTCFNQVDVLKDSYNFTYGNMIKSTSVDKYDIDEISMKFGDVYRNVKAAAMFLNDVADSINKPGAVNSIDDAPGSEHNCLSF